MGSEAEDLGLLGFELGVGQGTGLPEFVQLCNQRKLLRYVWGGIRPCWRRWRLLRCFEVLFCPAILLASLDPAVNRARNGNLGSGLDQSHRRSSVRLCSIEGTQQVGCRHRTIEDQTCARSGPAIDEAKYPDVLEHHHDRDTVVADFGADRGEIVEIEQTR